MEWTISFIAGIVNPTAPTREVLPSFRFAILPEFAEHCLP